MKVTKIRDKFNKRITQKLMHKVCIVLEDRFNWNGFITNVTNDGNSIKIGLHMRSFKIDTDKLPKNADCSRFARNTKKGYILTSTPTWEQREKFNHIINDVLDGFELNANVKNTAVSIRTFENGRIDCWDMERFGRLERAYYEIRALKELESERIASNVTPASNNQATSENALKPVLRLVVSQ